MKTVKVWSARLAALALAAVVPACAGTSNPGQVGVTSQSLWNSNAVVGAQPVGSPDFWHDPNSGIGGAPIPPDPEDITTYTMPQIFILGLRHPLQTQVSFNQAPNIVLNEQRAVALLTQYRHDQYVILLGNPTPLPPAATLISYPGITMCARAHCKHYAVWHPTLPLPLVNVEQDDVNGRVTKSQITTTNIVDFILQGPANFHTGDDVATQWINTLGTVPNGTLLDPQWTNLDVGFWQLGGTVSTYYWELILSVNPGPNVTLPQLPFPIFP